MPPAIETRLLSSLEKVFPDEPGRGPERTAGTMLRNEWHSACLAVRVGGRNQGRVPLRVSVASSIAPWVEVRKVGLVPSELPCYGEPDAGFLRTTPGLYPDVVHPASNDASWAIPGRWEAFWIRIRGDGALPPGTHDLAIRLETPPVGLRSDGTDDSSATCRTYRVTVRDALLPPQRFEFTQWLHVDCIARFHGVEPFSAPFWPVLERYLRMAADHGATLVLTPILTPPLDTAPGGERMTVQLVGVTRSGDRYGFDFSLLDRWIDTALGCGLRGFEFSHLFTQWGAAHAPKILATVDGTLRRLFGWDTDAAGPEYRAFLQALLPALRRHLASRNLLDACRFHLSDEPGAAHLARYRDAYQLVSSCLGGLPILDALSDRSFGRMGPDHIPVVALDHIGPFLDAGIRPLWGYYCCGQDREVSNRFFAMPSIRNRILGVQTYVHDLQGFLHWGYNFYNSRLSLRAVDPYAVTDADGAFPSGDPFSVYPVPDGCTESLRLMVFHDALQDHRALCLLEDRVGREGVLALVRNHFGPDFSFFRYPMDPDPLLRFRDEINGLL